MKKIKIFLLAGAAAILAIGFNACKTVKDSKDNITSAQDFSSSETEFAGTFDLSDDVAQTDGRIKKGGTNVLPSGAVLSWIDSTFFDGDGVEFSIDFGPLGSAAPKGMLCGDGKYRAGVIHYALSKRYNEIGATLTTTLADADNFYTGDGTNMFKITGNQDITRSAVDSVTIVTNGKVTDPDNRQLTFKGNKQIKVLAGLGTPGIWGDSYRITGNGSGVNRDGNSYTWDIKTPLIKKMEVGCAKTFVAGVIRVQNASATSFIEIDFDPYKNEACDRVAEANINGRKTIFTVR